jgi:hypothetical protein
LIRSSHGARFGYQNIRERRGVDIERENRGNFERSREFARSRSQRIVRGDDDDSRVELGSLTADLSHHGKAVHSGQGKINNEEPWQAQARNLGARFVAVADDDSLQFERVGHRLPEACGSRRIRDRDKGVRRTSGHRERCGRRLPRRLFGPVEHYC